MSIWQHQILLLPGEVVKSYQDNRGIIYIKQINNIDWWKNIKKTKVSDFNCFLKVLQKGESWHKDIVNYGQEDSDFISLYISEGIVIEISVRFDLRNLNYDLCNFLVDFSNKNELYFLSDHRDDTFLAFEPNREQLLEEIIKSLKRYNSIIGVFKDPDSPNLL